MNNNVLIVSSEQRAVSKEELRSDATIPCSMLTIHCSATGRSTNE